MKVFITILISLFVYCNTLNANQNINKLIGVWQYPSLSNNNKQKFEKWDKLNENRFKGIVYSLKKSEIVIEEYLELNITNEDIIYSATPINQNKGETINFTCKNYQNNNNIFIFENLNHDFPQQIIYDLTNGSIINIEIKNIEIKNIEIKKNEPPKAFQYTLTKLESENKQNNTEKDISKKDNSEKDSTNDNPNYDSDLAKKLEADDYGMKSYILVILKSGTNQSTDKEKKAESFKGHFENMNKMVEEGKLIVAGPISKNDNNYRGIFIINAADFEEAKSLISNDTAIKNGYLDFELYKWYGSAALPEYLKSSEKIWKKRP